MSDNILSEITSDMGPTIASQLASQLGLGEDQAQQAIERVAPLILGGLKRQGEQHGGEGRVNHIVQKYGRENVLDDLDGHIQRRVQDSNPDPSLGGLLGAAGPQAADLLDNKLGLSAGMGKKLIPILAPIILGALKKRANASGATRSAGGGNSGLAGGLLTSILDRDGDGNVLDDVAGMIFGGGAAAGGGRSGGGGFLMKLISMLFGRKG